MVGAGEEEVREDLELELSGKRQEGWHRGDDWSMCLCFVTAGLKGLLAATMQFLQNEVVSSRLRLD